MQRSQLELAPKHLSTLAKLEEQPGKDAVSTKEQLHTHAMKTPQRQLEDTTETRLDMMLHS